METAIFAACCFAYWAVLAVLAVIQTRQRAAPGTKPGTTVVGFFVMAGLVFGIGLALNAALRNLGFWTVGITHAAYLIYGLVEEVICQNRHKLKQ